MQVTLTLKRADPQTTHRVYLLTADCRVEEGSPAQCQTVLRMVCTIEKKREDYSAENQRRLTYQVQWQRDNATIFRDGLEVTE